MNTDLPNRNAILFLGPHEIKGLITMEEAIEAIAQGYEEADEFPIVNAPRRRVHSPDNVRISNFPGGIPGLGNVTSMTNDMGFWAISSRCPTKQISKLISFISFSPNN